MIAFLPMGMTRSLLPLPIQRKNPISKLILANFKQLIIYSNFSFPVWLTTHDIFLFLSFTATLAI
jgi:hypothetical protein